ncbi:SPS1 Serine/threonine protein kinase [Candidatus Planktophila versatilis]|uniref:protein kinase domain-containing protein n=1 Tax=Candidatus Planktophila versatilis TaxID=1884905 RepID=UPI003BEEFF25
MMNSLLGARYLLGEMIGTGGMADVYIAQDQRLSREVAIKILRSDLAKDPLFVARFRKEAKAAAGLNHPAIVAVYDSGEEPAPYIVMELVSGHTLRDLIHDGERLPLQRALEIAEGVLAGLEYSHARAIVHRDIKPANVMITDKGDVKVMDFGIARAMDDLGATLTNTWNVVGTAQYLSPEQAVGEPADSRSDIYSAGCLLFELLSGQPPFTGETPVSIAYQHASSTAPLIRTIQPDLPEGIETILAVALAKKPADRYQSAQEMLDDIARVRAGEKVLAKVVSPPVFTRNSALIYGGAFFAAIALAIGGYLYSGSSNKNLAQIPNVVGLSEAQARALLSQYTITIRRANDGVIPRGRVASQIPLATMSAQPGSSIVLTISKGPGEAIVPDDLIGMSLIDARAALTAVGLLVSQTIAAPSDEPQGTVLEVTPAVGSVTDAGSGVILTIASGEITVPDLVGVEAIQAKTSLIQAGFLINEFFDFDPEQPLGVVIRQAPDAESTQTIGKSVTITINREP